MKTAKNIRLFYFLSCLCLLISCDKIYKRQFIVDFQNSKAQSFTVSESEDLQSLYSQIEEIALKNDLKCAPYKATQKYYRCSKETVKITAYVSEKRNVSIELTQFGPWGKTPHYLTLEKDLSDFVKREFPGHKVQITDPLKN